MPFNLKYGKNPRERILFLGVLVLQDGVTLVRPLLEGGVPLLETMLCD